MDLNVFFALHPVFRVEELDKFLKERQSSQERDRESAEASPGLSEGARPATAALHSEKQESQPAAGIVTMPFTQAEKEAAYRQA